MRGIIKIEYIIIRIAIIETTTIIIIIITTRGIRVTAEIIKIINISIMSIITVAKIKSSNIDQMIMKRVSLEVWGQAAVALLDQVHERMEMRDTTDIR